MARSVSISAARFAARVVVTLLVSSFLVFAALYLSPGSPLAVLTSGHTVSPAGLHALEVQYHLNEPFVQRYWSWVTAALHGDFGESIVSQASVSSLLGPRVLTTLTLVLYAGFVIVVLGVLTGVVAAVRGGSFDVTTTAFTTVGVATPSFVVAIVLITVFAVELRWFPVLGGGTGVADRLWHLTLPAIALAVSGLAYVSQTTRTAVREELGSEHVETAISRGVPRRTVIRRHVVRNAAIPITTVAGLSIASLIAGVAVVETAFGIDGLGSYLIQAVQNKDFAVVQAISLILVTVFIITNAIVDVVHLMLDPRLRVPARR